jgi:hypothetical protein
MPRDPAGDRAEAGGSVLLRSCARARPRIERVVDSNPVRCRLLRPWELEKRLLHVALQLQLKYTQEIDLLTSLDI